MKTCLTLTSLTAFSLLWLSPTQTANAAGLTLALSSTNTSVGSLVSVAQVETATAVGTITSSGNAKVTLTSADIDGGTPLVLLVPVASGDTSSAWAADVRDALTNDLQVSELFDVGGTDSTITLTRKAQLIGDGVSYYAANDSTLNLALENDTAVGITTASSSEDTTDGELSSTAQVETATADGTITVAGNARVIVTADGLPGSPKTYSVAVSASDLASAWATKVRTVLGADSNLTSLYDVGGSSTSITLTRKKIAIVSGTDIFAANDPTLNINIDNFSCAGIIPQSLSVNTTAGRLENVGQVETATALGAVTSNGNVEVVITSADLGSSPKKILVPVTAGDSTSTWATKVRAALNADAAVSSLFTASGTGSKIILSRNADNVSPGLSIYPDNDPDLNLALFTGSKGIIPKLTSVDTMAGALSSQAQVETATANGTIAANGNLEVVVTAAGLPLSPKSINVPVLAGDTASIWAGKVRTAFNADLDITNLFVVGGAGDTISLTSKLVTTLDGVNLYADNDPTLYFAYAESDADGDGLKDKVETNTGIFVSATNTGTNANAADTDGDGINDDKETGTGIYVSLNNTGTNPNVADTDSDGLTDKQEIDGVNGFKSNPFLIDADGDLVSDFNEVNATPPTDPNDPSKYPSGSGTPVVAAEAHAFPVLLGDEQSVAVDQSYAPYGHRPDRDKFGDDGSSTIIDRNGVLIWSNKNGVRVTIPSSTFAKTLHVSNTECLVYSNRFVDGHNDGSHVAQIVMHRRGATGGIISSTPLSINGTVLDTASITPTTYGYMLVSGKRSFNGNESVQIKRQSTGSPPIITEIREEVDKWDLLDLTLNIITWDGARRTLAGGRFSIPKSAGANFSDGVVLGYGSDGSLLLNMTTALEFLDRFDDPFPGTFLSKTSSIWVSATINNESVRELRTAIDTLAYVDNDRLVGQRFNIGSGANEMVDMRQFSNGSATLASSLPLPAGENILPLAEYSRRGFSPYIYTLDTSGTSLKLYRADATITSLGIAVTLPFAASDASAFVRNPRDGSILIKSLDGILMWVPTTTNGTTSAVTGLGAPKIIPDSSKAKALFVTSKECVVWLNGDEPAINGTLPPVKIATYQLSGSNLIKFDLTPPIEGTYTASTNVLSPDPDLEGWYITTFEKDAPESVLMRTYYLQLAAGVDRDKDGITDNDEITGRLNGGVATDAFDPDTDDDGLSDGVELLPLEYVSTPLNWEAARLAAIAKGGKLVVLDTADKQERFKTAMLTAKASSKLWIGGHDTLKEGEFRWLTMSGLVDVSGALVAAPTNWQQGQPSNLNDADAMEASTAADFKWAMAQVSKVQAYVIEYYASNPNVVDTDGDGVFDNEERTLKGNPNIADTDGDGLTDSEEKTAGTSLILVDTDGDSLTDFAEVKTHNTDPREKDTDKDALEDDDEISLGTDPRDDDTDNDNLKDGDEVSRGTNPKLKDSDGDGLDDDKEVLLHLTNPNNPDTDGDGINDGDEVSKGTNPKDDKDPKTIDTDGDNLTNFDELFVHNTDPRKADTDGDGINDDAEIANSGDPLDPESDTDGDGLKDKVETRTGIFVSATNTGTNPYAADTDGDGINDDKETGAGIYVSPSNTGTNPNVADTDGDGLTDKDEIDGVNGFKSSPFLIDADGDLISDFNEVNATPPTDPNDPSKYPTGSGTSVITGLHASPILIGKEQSVTINESYAPYGHRPDRDKIGDDGSSVIIDRNGVLIWCNKNGEAVTIPNSSSAKTLHVSNTECLVYGNRFIDWNSTAHNAQIVIYRRGATGGITSSKSLTINGTVLDTSSVTPTTYGYLLVSGTRVDDGEESKEITQKTNVNNGVTTTTEESKKVDKWDILDLSLNVITWDGASRELLENGRISIPKNPGADFTDFTFMGYGSDGSILLNMTTAAEFLDRYDDSSPGTFLSQTSSIWISAEINKESLNELPTHIDTLAYVDNDRVIGQRSKFDLFSLSFINEIVDYRQSSNYFASEISSIELPAGERMLPLSDYSLRGFSPYIYTLDAAGTSLKLYKADATISQVGSAVTLPLAISDKAAFVRNPRDGSLLIQSLDGTLIWLPTTTNGTSPAVTGMGAPMIIPYSSKAKALFVTSKECVVWLNGDEPPLNGTLPPSKIAGYQINGNNIIKFNLTPPMEGNYAVLPSTLSPDPDLEGWYITTFEKNAPNNTLMRTYHLQLATGVDRDNDGITDADEITGRFNVGVATDPFDPDTDDDGLSDGAELLPYGFVSTPLGWEAARLAAIAKGGKLAVLDTAEKQDRFKTAMLAAKASGKLWIGGHDTLKEGEFRWLTTSGLADASGSLVAAPNNWQQGQPGNLNDADGMEVSSAADFKWAMAPVSRTQAYVIEYPATNPLESDTDGDGYRDDYELANASKPNDPASFPTYTLTLLNGGSATGGTFTAPGTFGHGTNAPLSATAQPGYKFGSWTGDASGTTTPLSLLMDSNKTVGATFVPDTSDTDGDGLTNYQELVTYSTDPTKSDTDGDGDNDKFEVDNGTSPSDPAKFTTYTLTLAGGGAAMDGTVMSGSFAATPAGPHRNGASVTLTATDKPGYNFSSWTGDASGSTRPLTITINGNKTVGATFVKDEVTDSDLDGFTDAEEVSSEPPTDPLDGSSKPVSPNYGEPHNVPNLRNDPVSISVARSFGSFGQRPNTDKTSEDGSVALRDENGAIIWANNRGQAVVVPNSSLAKTLYVSNSECVVWQNRFDSTFNAFGSNSQIVVHRRDSDGKLTSSRTITVNGTLLETSPVSPSTYGFTLVAASRFLNGDESRQRYQSGSNDNGPTYAIRDVDIWDGQSLTIYRITWDDQVQVLSNISQNVPKSGGNLGGIQVLGNGSDGSFFFNNTIARDFNDDVVPIGVRDLPGSFRSQTANFWVTTTQDKERIFPLGEWTNPTISAPYVTNNRIILETQVVDLVTEVPTGAVQLRDVRIQTNGSLSEASPQNLDAGDNVLPVSNYTRAGLTAFIYTIDAANTGIKLYQMDVTLKRLGVTVTLPAPIVRGNAYVRDPRDASLLIKTEGAGLVWIPASKNWLTGELIGLGRLRVLPNSSQAMPLFVSSTEAIAWMNASAPVDIANGGVLPNAQLSHFAISTENKFVTTKLAPPITGRYVALSPSLSPDAKTEGWYISTFTKASARSAVMRTYRLSDESRSDADRDGLPDEYENGTGTFVSKTKTGTLPTSIDSDGDGLSDGEEVYPFALIRGTYTWQQAREDAKNRGGRLAVIPDDSTYQSLRSVLGSKLVDLAWVGASDQVLETNWLWHTDWKFPQSDATSSVQSNLSWETGKPDNVDEADVMLINPNFYFEDASLTQTLRYYIIEYRASDPNKKDADGDLLSDYEERVAGSYADKTDSDSDGLNDFVEWKNTKTYALVSDSDEDGLLDGEEVNGWMVGSKKYTSDPLSIDTDDDGFDDNTERVSRTNPRDSQDKPAEKDPVSDEEKALNKQVRLEVPPADLTIGQPFAPFGNRTDLNRYGDDGSAMMVDVNGVLLWRDANGVNRQIPDSELHIPLVVSNSEAIVWTNGFSDYEQYRDKENVTVAIYRADDKGTILPPVPVVLLGKEILPTAPITTTSQAYHVVTSDHEFSIGKILFRVYRITYSGQVQALTQFTVDRNSSIPGQLTQSLTKVLGHGSDGSIIFAQDAWDTSGGNPFGYDWTRRVFWIDGVSPGAVGAGIMQELPDQIARDFSSQSPPDFGFRRVISTSRTQVIYEKVNDDGAVGIFKATRNSFNGLIASKDVPISGIDGLGRVLQMSSQTTDGDTRWFYAINKTGTSILVYRLSDGAAVIDYEATIPIGMQLGEDATVLNINRLDGSAVIAGENSSAALWLRDSGGGDPTKNIVKISNIRSSTAKPLFVTKDELVLWNNSRASVLPNGSLPEAMVTHYSFEPSTSKVVAASLSAKIDGTYIMTAPPFTSAPEMDLIPGSYEWPWLFTTVEKTGDATARFRTYRLQNWNIFDEDNDGLGSADEKKWNTNLQDPDTDRDGISDGLEVQPYRIITGNYTFEEARLDAILKGGWLARSNTKAKLQAMVRQLRGLNTGKSLWIGGGDMDAPKGIANQYEGNYRWVDNEGKFFNSDGSSVGSTMRFANWSKGQPSNSGNLDGLLLNADFTWSMASLAQKQGYVLETKPTNPLKPDGDGDRDGDGLPDRVELALGTDPYKADTDGDGLSDFTEVAVLFSNPLMGFLDGAPVTFAKTSFEGLLYSEQNGLLGKIFVNMENDGSFTGSYEIYNGSVSIIQGKLNVTNGKLIAGSLKSTPNIGATSIVLQKDAATGRNHLHARVNDSKFGNVYAKARPAAIGYKPLSRKFILEAALTEDVSGPTGTMVATGSITNAGGVSMQLRNPDGTTASSSGKVLDGGVIALYAKTSGDAPTHVMSSIKINPKTNSDFEGQVRLLTDEYDQARTLEGSFYTPPAQRSLPIATLDAAKTTNNSVFDWEGGELGVSLASPDPVYQVYSWTPNEIISPITNHDKTEATFNAETGLLTLDYTRSDKARNLYQITSRAYAVVNQRKNTINGFYSRTNWQGGSFKVTPNSQNKKVDDKVTLPPTPIKIPGTVASITPTTKTIGPDAIIYSIKVTGSDNWMVAIPQNADWISAEVINNDGSLWADKLTGRDSATVNVKVLKNTGSAGREAIIMIGDLEHEITQSAGRITSISPASLNAPTEGTNYSIKVIATGSWKLGVTAPWIEAYVINDSGYSNGPLQKNIEGQGNATINVTVSSNQTTGIRIASLIIGDKTHTITQRPAFLLGTVTSINPTRKNVPAALNTYNIRVRAKDNWTVTVKGDWLSAEVINDDGYDEGGNLTGSGNATIKVSVVANPDLIKRTGTIKIGKLTHTVTQAPIIESGTVRSISPTSKEVGKVGETYNIRVTGTKNWSISVPPDSTWLSVRVVNDNGFVYEADPLRTGSGNATVQVTVAPNASNRRRVGTINIGGKTHTCTQAYVRIR